MSWMFSIRSVPSMNSIATKLSQRQFIFLFVCLFVLYFQTADSYSNEVTLLACPMPIEYLFNSGGYILLFCILLFLNCFHLFGILLNE